MTRREFMKGVAVAAAAPLGLARAQTTEAVRLHAFSKPLHWLGYDGLAEAMAQAGCGGIDLAVRPKGHVEPERVEQDLPRAVEAARKQGLAVRMIVTAIRAADEPLAERTLKTAAQCGVQIYRMGYFAYDHEAGVEGTIERLRPQTAALAALNQRCGITGCYQNHYAWNDTLFGGSVWDVHAVLKGLDPQWIGCQYDVRHAVAEAGGSWGVAMRLIAPYIRSVCLKDFCLGQEKRGLGAGRCFRRRRTGAVGTFPEIDEHAQAGGAGLGPLRMAPVHAGRGRAARGRAAPDRRGEDEARRRFLQGAVREGRGEGGLRRRWRRPGRRYACGLAAQDESDRKGRRP